MKDYNRNNTLYSRLLAAAGDDKLPVLDNRTFESMNAEYGKEEMRKQVIYYFALALLNTGKPFTRIGNWFWKKHRTVLNWDK